MKKRYFVDNEEFNCYAGDTEEQLFEYIKRELEPLNDNAISSIILTITTKEMTDEEVENLQDL